MTAAQRREQVVRMRQARMSFAMIGKQLGITGQRAGQLYREALAQIPMMAVEEHRADALEMIDLAERQLMAIALDKEISPRTRVEAWSVFQRLEDRKDKITGVHAPTRLEVITLDAIDAEIAALTSALANGVETPEAASAEGAAG